MTRELEYLEEALIEAEEAARWYAQRSLTAAAGFASELEAAAQAITETPNMPSGADGVEVVPAGGTRPGLWAYYAPRRGRMPACE